MRLAGCLYLQSLGSGHPEQGVAARCSHSVTQVTGRNRRVHSEQSASWCSPFLSGCSEERSCSQGTDTQRWQQLTQKFSFKRRASEAPNKGIRRGEYVKTASFQCQSHPGKYQYPNGSLPARSWATPQKKRVHSGNRGGCSSHLG